jgi:hypothetical protein
MRFGSSTADECKDLLTQEASQGILTEMRIAESARKHGVPDEDILHALRNAISHRADDEFTMLIGPARNGNLHEIGILDADGDDPVVIHAMPVRPHLLP